MFFKTTRSIMLLIAASGLAPFFPLKARPELSVYKEVRDEYLKTFAQEKKEAVYSDSQNQTNKKPEVKLVVEELDNYTLNDLVVNMFMNHGTLQKDNGVIDSTFIRKMELLCGGENTQRGLLKSLIPANEMSIFGNIGFASILVNPTADISELHKRQAALATFNAMLNHEESNYALTSSFENIKNAQAEIIRYWHSEMNKDLCKKVYYDDSLGKNLNKSTIALEILTRLRNIGTIIGTCGFPIGVVTFYAKNIYNAKNGEISKALAAWEGLKKTKELIASYSPITKGFKNISFENTDEMLKSINTDEMLKSFGYEPPKSTDRDEFARVIRLNQQVQTLGDRLYVIDYIADRKGGSAIRQKTLAIIFNGIPFGIYAYFAKKTIDTACIDTAITNHIHERLIAVATCVREARNIYELLGKHEAIATMPAFQQLANFYDKNAKRSDNLSGLLSMLQTNTFKGKPSFFTITGRVLAAHTLMNEVKDELIPLFEALGHIEAYVAAAKFYAKHKELPSTCCLAEFVNADKPTISMKSFWNPFIDPTIVVTNDIVFDTTERNVILTGPNTAGKSTVIKGAELNILLAQTFGFCTAQQVLLTPFNILNCHLNITDDIATGTSLFHAEVKRAKALLNDIQSLTTKQFCFTIMDELFNGTNAEGGSEAAYKFSDQLGNYQNLILVIATHFGKLTELDKTKNFRNLHVGAHLDEHNKLIRPFKLQTGIFKDPQNKILQAILEQEGIFTPQLAA